MTHNRWSGEWVAGVVLRWGIRLLHAQIPLVCRRLELPLAALVVSPAGFAAVSDPLLSVSLR